MNEAKWIETKKECEISERGELIPKNVTLELEKEKESTWKFKPKEIIDLSLRLIGLVAIAVPIFLFYKGQQAERNKQKAIFKLESYSNMITQLHSLENKRLNSEEFEQSRNNLFYETYPKLLLLKEADLLDTVKTIKDIITYFSAAAEVKYSFDTLIQINLKCIENSEFINERTYSTLYKLRSNISILLSKLDRWLRKSDTSSLNRWMREFDVKINVEGDLMKLSNEVQKQLIAFNEFYRKKIKKIPKVSRLDIETQMLYENMPFKFSYLLEEYINRLDSMIIKSSPISNN